MGRVAAAGKAEENMGKKGGKGGIAASLPGCVPVKSSEIPTILKPQWLHLYLAGVCYFFPLFGRFLPVFFSLAPRALRLTKPQFVCVFVV